LRLAVALAPSSLETHFHAAVSGTAMIRIMLFDGEERDDVMCHCLYFFTWEVDSSIPLADSGWTRVFRDGA
jgi:hypothetical protein